MKCVIVVSGGLDSVVLLHDLTKSQRYGEVYAITYDYGQRLSREIDCARAQAKLAGVKEHKVIDLRFFKDISGMSALTNADLKVPTASEAVGDAQSLSYVPNRNMMMLSIAAAYAETVGAENVVYGAQAADNHSGYFDATNEFRDALNNVFNLNRKNRIRIQAPYIDKDKTEIVALGIQYHVDFKQTHTCYNGTEIACGKCVSDANRIQAFINNGVIDPIKYAVDIPWESLGCKPITY